MRPAQRVDVPTASGTGRVHVHRPTGTPRGSLLLHHGAGGGSVGADLLALTGLTDDGWTVVLLEQPWHAAGRRVGPGPVALDRAYDDLTASLARRRGVVPGPWVLGGRSAGARAACRAVVRWGTAGTRRPAVLGVLALAFPLHPPGRPGTSRAGEALDVLAAGVRLAVVQGERDPFGDPDEVRSALGPAVAVHPAAGAHSFTPDPQDVVAACRSVLRGWSGWPDGYGTPGSGE